VAGLVLHLLSHGLSSASVAAGQRADTACAPALVVEPDGAEGHRLYAEAIQEWATGTVQDGDDPGDAYDRAARLARRAMELSGGEAEAQLTLAGVFMNRAWWESRTDKDPHAALEQAVALQARVLAIDPRNTFAYDNMGQAHVLQGRFERLHGLDPGPAQARAVSDFEQALRIDASMSPEYLNLARAAVARADEQARQGLDASPDLSDVLRFIEQLPGDRTLDTRVDAVRKLRARLAEISGPSTSADRS
jgi:serine/threonine-protein kinase